MVVCFLYFGWTLRCGPLSRGLWSVLGRNGFCPVVRANSRDHLKYFDIGVLRKSSSFFWRIIQKFKDSSSKAGKAVYRSGRYTSRMSTTADVFRPTKFESKF